MGFLSRNVFACKFRVFMPLLMRNLSLKSANPPPSHAVERGMEIAYDIFAIDGRRIRFLS